MRTVTGEKLQIGSVYLVTYLNFNQEQQTFRGQYNRSLDDPVMGFCMEFKTAGGVTAPWDIDSFIKIELASENDS